MIKETVTMSHKELHRLQIIQESINRHITQEQAAARIGISIRQVKRLVQRYRNEGPSGLGKVRISRSFLPKLTR